MLVSRNLEAGIKHVKRSANEHKKVLQPEGTPTTPYPLTRMQELSLSNNRVARLSNAFGQLANLSILRIDGNELTELPATLGNYSALLPPGLTQSCRSSSWHLDNVAN